MTLDDLIRAGATISGGAVDLANVNVGHLTNGELVFAPGGFEKVTVLLASRLAKVTADLEGELETPAAPRRGRPPKAQPTE